MKGNDFIFDSVQIMYYKYHKVNFRRGSIYIDFPDWIKKATVNPKNEDNKCFQYAVTVALNFEEVTWNPERVSSIKLFINNYKWKGINYPSKIDNWKTLEKNNSTIVLNILYINKKEICLAYISKPNSTREKQVTLLMIQNEEKQGQWHYLATKKLSILLHLITSKNQGDFYCLICVYSFVIENKLKSHEKSM